METKRRLRQYDLFDYVGRSGADRVVVIIGEPLYQDVVTAINEALAHGLRLNV